MKVLISLILFMFCLVAFADVIKENMNDAFGYRIEEKKVESKRELAGENKVKPSDEEIEVVEESDRNVAGEDDQKDLQKHSHDLPYWKY